VHLWHHDFFSSYWLLTCLGEQFISEVQAKVGCAVGQDAPLLIRIETKAGHGGGKPTDKVIAEFSDIYAFVAKAIGAEWID
jgi:prolyl oligopeptidase